MITLPNNKKIDFLCASGALGFYGNGYWWEKPFYWAKLIRPQELTIITKTITFAPRKGRYRWYKPWETFRLIRNGTVNCLAMPNSGYLAWIPQYKNNYPTIVSVAPNDVDEATIMAYELALLNLVAIEINISCPNTDARRVDEAVAIVEAAKVRHPVIVKLGINYLPFCLALDDKVAAFNLINSVPWDYVYPDEPSPLGTENGLSLGAVSGKPIKEIARTAVSRVAYACRTPVITGGGLDSLEEVRLRAGLGASAFAFGTVFLRQPWLPNQIATSWRARSIK